MTDPDPPGSIVSPAPLRFVNGPISEPSDVYPGFTQVCGKDFGVGTVYQVPGAAPVLEYPQIVTAAIRLFVRGHHVDRKLPVILDAVFLVVAIVA